ncbi:MAG: phosphoribosyltransferase family protein [Dehalococcoidia bacterium]
MARSTTGNLWLAKELWDIGAIKFGDFNVGRTVHSPVYANLRLLISRPGTLGRIARMMKEETETLLSMLHPQISPFSLVAGVPFGGLHLATAYSLTCKAPMIYLHPTKDGRGNVIEGSYVSGQSVLIIDDLITGGTSIVETAQQLRDRGLVVKDAIVLLDRRQGGRERLKQHNIHLVPLLDMETLLNYLMSHGKISEDWYRKSLDYMENPQRIED